MAKKLTQEKAETKPEEKRVFEWVDGDEVEITVYQASLDEIERIEKKEDDGEEIDQSLVQEVIDEYVKEDLNVKSMPLKNAKLLMKQVTIGWGLSENEADDLIEERQGN